MKGKIMKRFFALLALLTLTVSGAEIIKWNAANKFKGWSYPYQCNMKLENGLLVLDITGWDSSIRNLAVKIPAAKYDAFEVDYRITGIPAVNHGELYFIPKGDNFNEKMSVHFQNLTTDGSWKTLRISLSAKVKKAWLEAKEINHLRLDLVNQSPGRIEIREIRVTPSLPELADSTEIRRARRFPDVKSELRPVEVKPLDMGKQYYGGYMLKSKDDIYWKFPPQGARFGFKQEFELDTLPVKALIHIGADDAYTSRLNGQHLAGAGSWYQPDVVELAPERFKIGKNILTGIYHNGGGPGGVYWDIQFLMPDGTVKKVFSDATAMMTPTGKDDWTYPAADAVWTPAELQNMPPAGAWGAINSLPYRVLLPDGLKVVSDNFPAAVESGKDYIWELEFANVTYSPEQKIFVKVESLTGLPLSKHEYQIKDVVKDGKWLVPVTMPEYLPSGRLCLKLSSSQVVFPEMRREFDYKNTRKKGADLTARVRDGEVYINGKRTIPILGHGDVVEDDRQHGYYRSGVELRGIHARTQDNSWWTGDDQYDFSKIDARINEALRVDKNVGIVLYFYITPPQWWGKKYSDELAMLDNGRKMLSHLAYVSFASKKYREDSVRAMTALLNHVKNAPYSDRMAGYVIAEGVTAEWIWWDVFDYKHLADYSTSAKREFAKYVAKYAPGMSPDIPSVKQRKTTGLGLFLDPENNRKSLLYTRFKSVMIAETIENVVTEARKIIGENKLLGIYYGYIVTAGNMGNLINGSHGELKRILDMPELDFLMCPAAYDVRNMGDCCDDGMPFAAIRAAGKMPVVEDDLRTHLMGIPQPYFQTPTAWLTTQIVRRSLGRNLSRNQMAEFNVWRQALNSKEVQSDLLAFRKAAKFIVDKNIKAQPEIAVVFSARGLDYIAKHSSYYLVYNWEYVGKDKPQFLPHQSRSVTGDLMAFQRTELAKIGAPVDYLLAEDLGKVADRPYKLWIFLNQFDTTPEFDAALKKIQSRNVTCLFMYAPGLFRNDRVDFANMERITGIKLQRKSGSGLARVSFDGVRTPETRYLRYLGMGSNEIVPLLFEAVSGKVLATYPDGKAAVAVGKVNRAKTVFCGVPKLSSEFLRGLADSAGVWVYSGSDDIMFASEAFVTLHAVDSGKKVLRFPRMVDVVDIYTGKILAQGVRQYTFDAKMHETRTFYFGNDAADFCRSLQQGDKLK